MPVYARQKVWIKEKLLFIDLNAEFDAVLAAVNNIDGSQIQAGALDSVLLFGPGVIGTTQLQTDAVDTAVIADGAVTGAKLTDLSVTAQKLASRAATNISSSSNQSLDLELATADTYVEVGTITLTLDTTSPGQVKIEGAIGLSGGPNQSSQFEIRRDTTPLFNWVHELKVFDSQAGRSIIPIHYVDTSPGTGSVTYRLFARKLLAAEGTIQVDSLTLSGVEYRR